MKEFDNVRVAVIGSGFGKKVLVPAFRHDRRCAVTHIASSTVDGAKKAAREVSVENASSDWTEICKNPHIDLIAIATPPVLQPQIALSALKHGKALFVEKPLAPEIEKAKEIQELAQARKIPAVIDFEFPEIPAWQKTKELLAENILGNLRHIQYNWHVESYINKINGSGWKTEPKNGGVINLFGSHAFYNIEWLFGKVKSVKASLLNKKGQAEKNVAMVLELESGCPVTLSISNNSYPGTGQCLSVYGESGSLHLNNQSKDHIKGFELILNKRDEDKKILATGGGYGEESSDIDGRILATGSIVKKLLDSIRDSQPISPNLEDGVRVQELIDAARLSCENDITVNTTHTRPSPQLSGAKK